MFTAVVVISALTQLCGFWLVPKATVLVNLDHLPIVNA